MTAVHMLPEGSRCNDCLAVVMCCINALCDESSLW